MLKMSKQRMMSQVQLGFFNESKHEQGCKFILMEVVSYESHNDEILDYFVVRKELDNKRYRLLVKDYMRMIPSGDCSLYVHEDGAEDVYLPDSFTIVSSRDRLDHNGDTFYFPGAYNEPCLAQCHKDHDDMVAAGTIANNPYDVVQDYIISTGI